MYLRFCDSGQFDFELIGSRGNEDHKKKRRRKKTCLYAYATAWFEGVFPKLRSTVQKKKKKRINGRKINFQAKKGGGYKRRRKNVHVIKDKKKIDHVRLVVTVHVHVSVAVGASLQRRNRRI